MNISQNALFWRHRFAKKPIRVSSINISFHFCLLQVSEIRRAAINRNQSIRHYTKLSNKPSVVKFKKKYIGIIQF